jgi:hypothetical protein
MKTVATIPALTPVYRTGRADQRDYGNAAAIVCANKEAEKGVPQVVTSSAGGTRHGRRD